MRMRSLFMVVVLAGTSACATAARSSGPDAIARLERARAAQPRSEPVLRALGIVYYKAGRLPEARSALEEAAKQNPRDGTVALYLGMTAEAQNDLSAARTAYSSYLTFGRTKRVRSQLSDRLAALERKEIAQRAKAQVEQERTLSSVAGGRNVVAVMPLTFTGVDTTLKALERGLAELLTTDLARSRQLTVVERARIQSLLDEIKLQQSGTTDASTNVRAGKILQAGRMVQGSILQQGQQLRVDAAVIDVPTTQVAGSTNDDQALDQLFTLERNIVLGLFQQLGITLTTAERNEIEQRPTRSIAAFLSYSRGLLEEDQGRYDDANRYYQNAVRIDPGFGVARTKVEQTQSILNSAQVTTQQIEQGLNGTAEGQIVQQASAGSANSDGQPASAINAANDLNPTVAGSAATAAAGALTTSPTKDPAGAGTGLDNLGGRPARIEIRVQRP